MRDYTTKRETDIPLLARAQAGEAESLDELISRHEGLVHYVVRQQWRGSLSYREAMHAGRSCAARRRATRGRERLVTLRCI